MKLRNYICVIFAMFVGLVACKGEKKQKTTTTVGQEAQTPDIPVGTPPITGTEPIVNQGPILEGQELIDELRSRNSGNFMKFAYYSSALNSHVAAGSACTDASDIVLGRVQDCGGRSCSGKNRICSKVVDWKDVSLQTPVIVDVVLSPYNLNNPTPKCPEYKVTENGSNRQLVLDPYEGMPLQICDHEGKGCSQGTRQICSYRKPARELFLGTSILQKLVMTPEMVRTAQNAAQYDKYHLPSSAISQRQQAVTAGQMTQQQFNDQIKSLIAPICTNLETRDRAAGKIDANTSYEPLKYGHSFLSNCSHSSGNGVGCSDARVLCGVYSSI